MLQLCIHEVQKFVYLLPGSGIFLNIHDADMADQAGVMVFLFSKLKLQAVQLLHLLPDVLCHQNAKHLRPGTVNILPCIFLKGRF